MEGQYAGLDGGSTYLKAALFRNGRVVDTMVCFTGIDNNGAAERLLSVLCGNTPQILSTS